MSIGDPTTVFIIDDDAGVREAIQELVESVGLHAESFATAQEFLSSQRRDGPSCLVLDVRLPGISGLDLQQRIEEGRSQNSHHFHHRPRRHSDDRPGDEVWRRRVPHEAIQGSGPARCDSARAQP